MEVFIKKFEELNIDELYEILKLRNEVFIVEQTCPYDDIDGEDRNSIHIFQKNMEEIVSYLRIIIHKEKISIGRVLVKNNFRGKNLSKEILNIAIEYIFKNFEVDKIYIEAQTYLIKLYESLGFNKISEEFLLDNIPHIKMELERRI